jgi:TRAP-type uncharacterized transport system substrate-binding protein
MRKVSLFSILLLVLAFFVSNVLAGELIVTTGVKGGTYSAFYDQIRGSCANPVLTEWMGAKGPASGSIENVKNLLGNKANIGFVQEDVLWSKKIIDNDPAVDGLKTLMVLYPEEVHIIVMTRSSINRFGDLGNKKIATWGGSLITTKVLMGKTGIRPNLIIEATGADNAVQLLDSGKVEAIIAVGGQPVGWIENLPNKFKLAEFDRFQQVNDIYSKAVLNYPNLSPAGINSISTMSMIVTRDYKTDSKITDLNELVQCVYSHLDDLVETTGNHPKWELVKSDNKSSWPKYDKLRAVKAVTKPVPKKSK